jgi:DNA-directed RNA polymerase subunit L
MKPIGVEQMSIEEKLESVQLLKTAKQSLETFIESEDHQLHAVLLRKHSSIEDEVAHLRMKVDSMNRSLKKDTHTFLKYLQWYLDKLLEIRRSKNSPNKTMLLTMELCEKLEEYDFSTFEENEHE